MNNITAYIILILLITFSISCGGERGPSVSIDSNTPISENKVELDITIPVNTIISVRQFDTTNDYMFNDTIKLKKEDTFITLMSDKGLLLYSTFLYADELHKPIKMNAISTLLKEAVLKEGLLRNKSSFELGISYWFDITSINDSDLVYEDESKIKNTFGPIVNRLTLLDMLYFYRFRIKDIVYHNELRDNIIFNNTDIPKLIDMLIDSEIKFLENPIEEKKFNNKYYKTNKELYDFIKSKDRDALGKCLIWSGGTVNGVIEGAIQKEITIYSNGEFNANTITDDLGNYSVFLPVPGVYDIKPSKFGYSFKPNSLKVLSDHGVYRTKNFESYIGSTKVPDPSEVVLGVEYIDENGEEVIGSFKPISSFGDIEYYTLLAAGQVEYTLINGTTVSGQFTVPDVKDVKNGVKYGLFDDFIGQYTATNSDVPSVDNVLEGIIYTSNNGTTKIVGTYKQSIPPLAEHTLFGISYTTNGGGLVEGNLMMPSENVVLDSITYTSNSGIITRGKVITPFVDEVLAGVVFSSNTGSNTIGTLVLPTTGQVSSGVLFGPSGRMKGTLEKATTSLTGTYTGNFISTSSSNLSGNVIINDLLFPTTSGATDGQVLAYSSSNISLYFTEANTLVSLTNFDTLTGNTITSSNLFLSDNIYINGNVLNPINNYYTLDNTIINNITQLTNTFTLSNFDTLTGNTITSSNLFLSDNIYINGNVLTPINNYYTLDNTITNNITQLTNTFTLSNFDSISGNTVTSSNIYLSDNVYINGVVLADTTISTFDVLSGNIVANNISSSNLVVSGKNITTYISNMINSDNTFDSISGNTITTGNITTGNIIANNISSSNLVVSGTNITTYILNMINADNTFDSISGNTITSSNIYLSDNVYINGVALVDTTISTFDVLSGNIVATNISSSNLVISGTNITTYISDMINSDNTFDSISGNTITTGNIIATNISSSNLVVSGTNITSYINGLISSSTSFDSISGNTLNVGNISSSNLVVSGTNITTYISNMINSDNTFDSISGNVVTSANLIVTGYTISSNILPTATLSYDIGSSTNVWRKVWTESIILASDRRYKENIKDIDSSTNIIQKLRPVSYTTIKNQRKAMGLIAQEVQEILPNIVSGEDRLAVNYIEIIPLLIKAIQEQQESIDELTNELKEMKK